MSGLAAIEARGGSAGRAAAAFRAAVREGRLGQTYLIFGPTGAGKMELARAVAAAAACLAPGAAGDACGACTACRAGTSGAEADLAVLSPLEGKREILIDQVRSAIADLALAPLVGRTRALVVAGAEALREEAANAFLKTLEEPPERALVLLLTARPDRVLPTIRSRALEVRLAPRREGRGPVPELCAGAARALLAPGRDPFDRAEEAALALERAAAEDDRETVARTEKVRRAALATLDELLALLREGFRARAEGGVPVLASEAAILAALAAAERIEANATPRLVLEVLALDLARAPLEEVAPCR
jgi:DNA polymerase-3 subunit delta'